MPVRDEDLVAAHQLLEGPPMDKVLKDLRHQLNTVELALQEHQKNATALLDEAKALRKTIKLLEEEKEVNKAVKLMEDIYG